MPLLRERRTETRFAVAIPAHVAVAGGAPIDCAIIDISGAGCRLRVADRAIAPGMDATLTTVDGCTTLAHVVWRAGDIAGLWFKREREPKRPTLLQAIWRAVRSA